MTAILIASMLLLDDPAVQPSTPASRVGEIPMVLDQPGVIRLDFSAEGRHLVSLGLTPGGEVPTPPNAETLIVWSTADGTEVVRRSGVRQFALSPDRRTLYYTRLGEDDALELVACKPDVDKVERVWRLDVGDLLVVRSDKIFLGPEPQGLGVSPAGRYVAVGGANGYQVFDVQSDRPEAILSIPAPLERAPWKQNRIVAFDKDDSRVYLTGAGVVRLPGGERIELTPTRPVPDPGYAGIDDKCFEVAFVGHSLLGIKTQASNRALVESVMDEAPGRHRDAVSGFTPMGLTSMPGGGIAIYTSFVRAPSRTVEGLRIRSINGSVRETRFIDGAGSGASRSEMTKGSGWTISDDGRVFAVHKRGNPDHGSSPGFWIYEATSGRQLVEDATPATSPTRPLPVAVAPDGEFYARTRLSSGTILLGKVPFDH